ncbi:tRNA preQ1(34) S-adenosylmethionine ribosyltransferase-isomerase QueA [Marinicella sp. S1101]|uniref:tRNA preQ1(34) S-adenosylmethionine ribosyltransferase-isomerase QueA n=1 Tax=Marinicella marina TaxID=2996016 RepID=UPI002260B9B7|nr:tRNA preQ1(34) S-adenosylmethionine ribosyltransferase-isomerase QueA [Marinicella marina]MCX7553970.1 tRNA preQ1(34) S-adenosylmethionine ribosyltransferase-isomerase QueA [Marinicella marina]MDJ1140462.1 tRNA preQ1(34) S-adenosylmethionine ribosyltransferase-isomerase QueA [Marinicella marina]
MKKADFNFELPSELIAQQPLAQRSRSRLLKLDKQSGQTTDLMFTDILNELNDNDLLVFNNTKVIPARLLAQKATGGKVEVFIERVLNSGQAKAMLKTNKAVKLGTEIYFDEVPKLVVTARQGMFYLVETVGDMALSELMESHGHMPLPPYISRAADETDDERYQTVYADDNEAGAVAAPTAGLHFDDELLAEIQAKGVQSAFVTLHVGAGTFQPVKTDDIEAHQMHKEWLKVDQSVCTAVQKTQAKGGRVIAVGTTAVRCLETATVDGVIQPFEGDTEIFIYPGYDFKTIDGLITNFHLPESTLVMLVSAMAGRENILNAYQHAVDEHYRFFSYGDAMLIV